MPAAPVPVTPIEASVACAFCGESIKPTAKVCKHCGETLDPTLRAAEEAKRESRRRGRSQPNIVVEQNVEVVTGRASFAHWHVFHLIMTLVTCGVWLPVWLTHWVVWVLMH
jgi:hypothetical protein